MPSSEDITLTVLVGGVAQPEYERGGMHYVESKLHTPYSFLQYTSCHVNGELESQNMSVTPYRICVASKPTTPQCYCRVYVDGHKVKSLSLNPGEQKIVEGFRDGDEIKQFLFSLPRFPEHEADRVASEQESQVGVIRVECRNGSLKKTLRTVRTRDLSYRQANKKDGSRVTKGEYLMMTTKVGEKIKTSSRLKATDFWNVGSLRSEVCIKYVMGHTLTDMGFTLRPVQWPSPSARPAVPCSSSTSTIPAVSSAASVSSDTKDTISILSSVVSSTSSSTAPNDTTAVPMSFVPVDVLNPLPNGQEMYYVHNGSLVVLSAKTI